MKVGIPIAGFMDWGGGIDFLRIILKGLNAVQEKYNLQLVILVPEAKKLSYVDQFKLQINTIFNKLKLLYLRKLNLIFCFMLIRRKI
jgi:hypothetical protein